MGIDIFFCLKIGQAEPALINDPAVFADHQGNTGIICIYLSVKIRCEFISALLHIIAGSIEKLPGSIPRGFII